MNSDLIERLETIFRLDPTAVAIEQKGESFSYAQLHELIQTLDKVLIDQGLGQSVPVGLLLRNHTESFAAALAIIWTRRCLVTVNPLLPARALSKDLDSLQLPVLIAERSDWSNPSLSGAAAAAGSIGIALDRDDAGLHVEIVMAGRLGLVRRELMPGVAVEMLTSGTTGQPKRIKLELASLSRSLSAGSEYESSGGQLALRKSPSLLWMPLVHIGGLWNALYQVYNGRRILLLERFNIDAWHDAIKGYQLRFVTLPPSALGEVLERNFPTEDLSSLTAIRCGAAPLNHDLAKEFESRYGIPVLEAYGATEFAGGVAGWTIRDHRAYSLTKRKSVGRANPGVELRVVDSVNFVPVPSDTEGLLEVRTGQISGGKSWVRTTDRAKLDADGFLFILGRADNAINRGGFKITPEHVESALRAHPDLAEVCVVGIDDDRVGQVPAAAFELKTGVTAPSGDSLKKYLSEVLKPYEIPARFLCVAALPRTASLKVSQLAVRELFSSREPPSD